MKNSRRQPRIFRNTSDFTRIDYGDIIHVDNRYFLLVGYTKEGRFGIDEQAKQWVPKVYNLETMDMNDLSLLSRDRVFNLRKLYPWLPKCFNDILLHFSTGTSVMDDTADEFYDDLAAGIKQVYG